MSLDQLWDEMRRAEAPGPGRLLRRIRSDSPIDLHVGLMKPEDERLVTLTVRPEACPSGDLPSTRGTHSGFGAPTPDGRIPIELRLVDPAAAEVFAALAEDTVNAAAEVATDAEAAEAWIGRLRRWQRLLERLPVDGLSPEAQRGLYAELWTLRDILAAPIGLEASIEAWTGPEPALHDFQHPAAAIEVKSTAGAQHQVLRISSERQLDDTGTNALFLVHLSLDARLGGGETLPEIVASLRHAARGTGAEGPLEDRLVQAAYLDVHSRRYPTGYTVRRLSVYQVLEGFPRIVERDLQDGIGDVRYSVAVTECRDWECPVDDLIARLENS